MTIPGDGTCANPKCSHPAARGQLMCRACWFSVPAPYRAAVNNAWRGWLDDKVTLGELREAQERAIATLG